MMRTPEGARSRLPLCRAQQRVGAREVARRVTPFLDLAASGSSPPSNAVCTRAR